MKQIYFALVLAAAPVLADAQAATRDILASHILPRFETLAASTAALADTASRDCAPTSDDLRTAYGTAFDAWVSASHLRFGPTEEDDRAFALAFWPDSRGATPRVLAGLIATQDPVAATADTYADVSIAARGFYALEYLLYDETLGASGDPAYTCTLVQTVTADMAVVSAVILESWHSGYADELLTPGPQAVYRSDAEVLQEMLKALSAGLQFTSDSRLGRPLGSFDRPRPTRAEARRSGRSARHVLLSLDALEDLADLLAPRDNDLQDRLAGQFDDARNKLIAFADPIFASIDDPQSRLKLEIIQQGVDNIRATVSQDLGPTLGVAAGFNALDGD